MRRYIPYIILAIFLPILFGSFLLYQNWSKARRERMIQEALQEARWLEGVEPDKVLIQLTSTNPELAVVILYTGNTQGNLEPCGCYIGQSGGVARRATIVERFRKEGLQPLLVDAGGWTSGETELERLKTQTYLKAMSLMGYMAVSLNQQDFRRDQAFPFESLPDNNIPAVLTIPEFETKFAHPYKIVTVGGFSVAFLGASNINSPDEKVIKVIDVIQKMTTNVSNQADVVVLLSSLPSSLEEQLAREVEGIDLIISASERKTEKIRGTLLVGSVSQGKMLGFAQWQKGGAWKTGQIYMTEEVPDEPKVNALLKEFYQRVANDLKLQVPMKRLFAKEVLEKDPNNSYVGAEACRDCHSKEYKQWETTAHAAAYHTLLQSQRHFYSECVTCHVTGFGYKTGFQIGQDNTKHLAGVQCESCHGPGRLHVSSPTATNIRGKIETTFCQQCHNDEHHPGFLKVAEHLRPKVDHTETIRSFKELLTQRSKLPSRVEVELFVMSFCPYGVKAEQTLIPILREFSDKVHFKLRFIANEVKENSSSGKNGSSRFEAPHGMAELEENIRQAVIAEHEPKKLFDYLLCRAKNLKGSWETCARKVGIDVLKVQRIAQSRGGGELFRKNIQRTQELKVFASPTLYVDGRQFSNELFTRSSKSAKNVCGM